MADTVEQNAEQFNFAPLKKLIAANGDILAQEQEGGDSNFFGLVDKFLGYTEKNGIPEGFTWSDVKSVLLAKFDEVTKTFEAEQPIASLPSVPNVDNYTFEEYRTRILEHLNRFEDSPFTLGRICELLREPRKHYDRGDKFLRAFEKCVTVTSTNGDSEAATNGVHTNGHTAGETTTDTNGHTNGVQEMETDGGVTSAATNGHVVEGADSGTGSGATTEAVAPVVNEPIVADSTATIEESAVASLEETAQTVEASSTEEEKPSQKRSIEDPEHDVAKKIARLENNSDGVTHAVVGEPEVEPHGEESKKVEQVTVDGDAVVTGTTEEITATPLADAV